MNNKRRYWILRQLNGGDGKLTNHFELLQSFPCSATVETILDAMEDVKNVTLVKVIHSGHVSKENE